MNTSVKAVGFTLREKDAALVEDKLKRIAYADDLIVDLLLMIKHDKIFTFDFTINFRWGKSDHVSDSGETFAEALNKTMDVLDNKIKKEKDKVQERK